MSGSDERATRKEYVFHQLSPEVLLGNMAAAREQAPSYEYYKIGVITWWLGDPASNRHDFEGHAKLIEEELTSDAKIAARLRVLREMGFNIYFGVYDEPWRSELRINIIQNLDADRRLSTEALTSS